MAQASSSASSASSSSSEDSGTPSEAQDVDPTTSDGFELNIDAARGVKLAAPVVQGTPIDP